MFFPELPENLAQGEPCYRRKPDSFQLRCCLSHTILLILYILGLATAPALAQNSKVIFNEIMYNPGYGEPGSADYVQEDTNKEFIELYNPGNVPIQMAGWKIKGGISFRFPEVTLPPQGFLVITGDGDTNRFISRYRTNYPAVTNALVLGGWTRRLSNHGESLELEDGQGQRVDFVAYANQGDWAQRREGRPYAGQPSWYNGWRWVSGADGEGKSLERVQAGSPSNLGQNWAASVNSGGTPGGANSVARMDIAPLIYEVNHYPAIPKSTDSVFITTRIFAGLKSLETVQVHYRLDGEASFHVVSMEDDSLHGDGQAGDGLYGAVLPAQADQSVVEFYIQAEASPSLKRTWPGPTDDQGSQGANALYQVDNSSYAGPQPIYRLVITRADWDAWSHLVDATSGGRFSNARMNATFISADQEGLEARYNVGVRNRGAGTRAAHPHNLELEFPADRPWKGMTDLALNTRAIHSQAAGDAVNLLAGLPSTAGWPVQLRINGKNLANLTPTGQADSYQFGSYYAFQPYGSEWLESHLPQDSEGNLYRGVWYLDYQPLRHAADLAYLGDDAAAYRLAYSPLGPTSESGPYSKQNNTSENDWSDLINLCRVLNQTPDSNYIEQVRQVVDIEEWLNYFAVTALVGNRETTLGTGAGDDYSLYRGNRDPRFKIFSHDMDTVLGQGDALPRPEESIFLACRIPAINRFLKHPAITPRYYAALKKQADTTFASSQINPLLDRVLGGWVPEPYITSMKDFAALRRSNVLAQIGPAILDQDDDGMPDAWELANGLNPKDPRDASLDSDGDGLTNLQEYRAGSNPASPRSSLVLKVLRKTGSSIQLEFQAIAGKAYTIQYREGLSGSEWLKLQDIFPSSSDSPVMIELPVDPNLSMRYFRLLLNETSL